MCIRDSCQGQVGGKPLPVIHIALWITINRGEQIFGCVLAVYGVAVPGGAILRPDAEGAFHPVSYTHLDVYKRQGVYWSITRWLLTFTGIPPISVSPSLSMAFLKARRRFSGMACHRIWRYTS